MAHPLVFIALVSLGRSGTLGAPPDSARCAAQDATAVIRSTAPLDHPAPFAIGERLQYSVSFGRLHVGSATMLLIGRDTTRGRVTWNAMFSVSGGFSFFSVHDSTVSWFEPLTFNSLRFVQELREPRYHASRYFDIYPERQTFRQRGELESPSVADAMDDVSFVYFARTLRLEPGQCYELRRYFRPDGNPVVIRVVRRDTLTVPAGTFNAIVLQPELTTSGIFSKNGRAQLWLSDDSARVLLQLKSQLSFGSINLYLTRVDTARTSP